VSLKRIKWRRLARMPRSDLSPLANANLQYETIWPIATNFGFSPGSAGLPPNLHNRPFASSLQRLSVESALAGITD
jgi:hypothetical protein